MKRPISHQPGSLRRREILLLAFLAGAVLLACIPNDPSFLSNIGTQAAYAQQSQPETDPAVRQMLSIAESEHDIIRLLIKQGQYQRVVPEMKQILSLDLPSRYEAAVAQSASLIAEMLVEKSQFATAHEVIDESLKKMRLNENKAALWKIKAYVFKSEGNFDQALQCLQKAIDLEKAKN